MVYYDDFLAHLQTDVGEAKRNADAATKEYGNACRRLSRAAIEYEQFKQDVAQMEAMGWEVRDLTPVITWAEMDEEAHFFWIACPRTLPAIGKAEQTSETVIRLYDMNDKLIRGEGIEFVAATTECDAWRLAIAGYNDAC
jgi:hypothetical protein